MSDAAWRDWLPRVAAFHSEILKATNSSGTQHLYRLPKPIGWGMAADLSLLGVSAEAAVEEEILRIYLGDPAENAGFEDEPDAEDIVEQEPDGEEEDESQAEMARRRERAAAACRKIFLKQKGSAYNRETSIGFPLVGGRVGRRHFSGPLLYWLVEPSFDAASNTLRLSRPSSSPVLNSILLAKFADEDAEMDLAREQILPLLQSEDFDRAAARVLIRQLAAIFNPLKDLREHDPDNEPPLASFLATLSGPLGHATWAPVPILLNAPRSFAFIQEDLKKLAGLTDAAGGTAATGFVGELPEEVPPLEGSRLPFYDTLDGDEPLLFPSQSNESQRRVGRKARRYRTVVVQGPPGTGKSQTIANVVSDIVAAGKTVLVTSDTRKALDVLDKKLPRIPHLAVSVLSSDRESLAQLKSELESVQESANAGLAELTDEVHRAERALTDLDSELRRLDRRFSELRQLESEQFSNHARLSEIRDLDRVSPSDQPDYNKVSETAEALREYGILVEELAADLSDLRTCFRPRGAETSRAREQVRQLALKDALRLAAAIRRPLAPTALELSRQWVDAGRDQSSLRQWLGRVETWLDESGAALEQVLRWASTRAGHKLDFDEFRGPGLSVPELEEVAAAWEEKREFFSSSSLTGGELRDFPPTEREDLRRTISRLRPYARSRLGWYLAPTAYRARKRLSTMGIDVGGRRSAADELTRLDTSLEWQSQRDRSHELAEAWDASVPTGLLDGIPPNPSSVVLQRCAADRNRAFELQKNLRDSPLQERSEAELGNFGTQLLRRLVEESQDSALKVVKAARDRLEELAASRKLHGRVRLFEPTWGGALEAVLRAAAERNVDLIGEQVLDGLQRLAGQYPKFKRLVDLETRDLRLLPETRAEIEDSVLGNGGPPEWLAEAETAIEAHRLAGLLRQSLAADPDDLSSISDQLARGQVDRRQIIVEVIRRRRKLAVRKAIRSAATNNALHNMRTLLGRRRMSPSFLSLRDRIDYRELLKVFPCWICSIDDVARLFPLEAALFDYVIVDEASQCPQTALLPLAYRARRALIVGDQKQLQPASVRFLSQNVISVTAERAGMKDHPVAEVLDGKHSLLNVAERFREETDFLDEHFRCDPPIIRWSNAQFYDNRLKILTHRRDRVFRPVLEVRELLDADDDRDKKVNRIEAEVIVREVQKLLSSEHAERMTLGVISPYRKQADLINAMLEQEFAGQPELKKRAQLLASTADGFQGDERDIILYSFRYGPSSHPGTVTAIEREEERLNVAFSRARRKVICFVSQPISRFPKGLIRSFLEHAREVETHGQTAPRRPDQFDSQFESDVCCALRDRGPTVSTQEPVAGFFIDLVVEDNEGRVLAVECDGDFKFNEFGELRPDDYQRQDVIERAGWSVHRIAGRRWLDNPEREIDRVIEALQALPSAKDREVALGPRVLPEPSEDMPTTEAPPSFSSTEVHEVREAVSPAQPSEETVPLLERLGSTTDERVEYLQKLWRWGLGPGDLSGSALDALDEIFEKVSAEAHLTESERQYLSELITSAVDRGFDPDSMDDLPGA